MVELKPVWRGTKTKNPAPVLRPKRGSISSHQSHLINSFLVDFPMAALVSSNADNPALLLQLSDVIVHTIYGET